MTIEGLKNGKAKVTPGKASKAPKAAKPGVAVARRYTAPGVDPLDAVAYERRDSVIQNPDGSVVFGMRGAEIPRGWSQLATDIAVSKYFRKSGLNGDAARGESSARQLVYRVAHTIREAGEARGYFADEAAADTFEAELSYLLIHQYGAFNSPVWFNCGLFQRYGIEGSGGSWAWSEAEGTVVETTNAYERPQCSACFIQSVSDDLMSIFELVKNEARLFKYGSGTGSNFSALRGRQEKLSGGGTSSGLMSFLEVFDRAAGSTKSGGTTRRAAKMVCLDMDHPEVVDFIEWKMKEEKKAQALIAQGYPSDFNGEAYHTVSGQNSNNSIRVTDEFMRAVETGGTWSTRMRTTGEVVETHQARDLWRKIAESAWTCADPGVQYDTTINEWHTVPNSGRINASNPCSEYMHLDDTACNLSSLNLTKFLKEEPDGTLSFDVEGYRHAARVFFVAQEILVDFSSYPTKTIAQNSHDYRPLGLGYANLGTLLMVMGLAYDSDAGRATAAALTAILTGQAYRASADMAAVKGPFAGFKKNRDPMLRVMRKHRDAAYGIDARQCPPALLRAAREDWDVAVAAGEAHGYRNAQATVLAPTGTIGLLMDCDTTGIEPDFALVKYKKLAGGGYFKIANASVERALLRLGYSAAQVAEILAYVSGTNTFVGAPHVTREFLRAKGLTGEEITRVEAALPGAFALEQAFAPHVVGVDALKRLGLDEEAKAPGFSLLRRWAVTQEQLDAASDHIIGRMTVEGAPHLRAEHLSVFDCANRCGKHGRRFIAPIAHVKMMAAVQPFLSGAISKCVTGDTLIATERGIMPIRDLYRGEAPDTFRKEPLTLASEVGTRRAVEFYYGGERPVLRLRLADGRTLSGTPNHRVKVGGPDGYEWKHLDEVAPGDYVAVRLGAEVWSEADAALTDFAPSPAHGNQKALRLPARMTPELGRFLGYYIAEGNKNRSNWTVVITNNDEGVLARANAIAAATFGIEGRVVVDPRNGVRCLTFASKTLCEFLDYVGAADLAAEKRVPWAVLRSTRETVLAFVSGLWLDGYASEPNRTVAISLASRGLLEQLQVVLDNLGVRAVIGSRWNKEYARDCPCLYVNGPAIARFASLVALDEAHKRDALARLASRERAVEATWSDVVPCFRREAEEAVRSAHATQEWRSLLDPRTRHMSWETARQVCERFDLPALRPIIENNIHFVPVRTIEDGCEEVFDFHVPDTNAFLGNGVVNHNTVNLPHEATVDEIAEIYLQGWKLGLKAVALYRDGCKASQPLSTTSEKKDKAEAKTEKKVEAPVVQAPVVQAPAAAPTAVATEGADHGPLFAKAPMLGPRRAVRYRLPKKRRGFTQEARVGGHKVFLRTGEYEDGQLGEVFIDMHKEGAAFRSLMNCFAIAVSLGLQHGVPLAEFVDMFSYTRFEPQGPVDGHPNVKFATSIIDYVFRVLGVEYLHRYDLAQVPPDEADDDAPGDDQDGAVARASTPGIQTGQRALFEMEPASKAALASGLDSQLGKLMGDAPMCDNCGHITVRNGSCYRCLNCGSSMGCS